MLGLGEVNSSGCRIVVILGRVVILGFVVRVLNGFGSLAITHLLKGYSRRYFWHLLWRGLSPCWGSLFLYRCSERQDVSSMFGYDGSCTKGEKSNA